MIIKLLKKVYESPDDFAVRTPINELVCKIAHFHGGYYLYNKMGDQIAQIILESNTAYLSISGTVPVYPASIKMVYTGHGSFVFSSDYLERDDEQYLSNIKGKKAADVFNLRGDTLDYSYDLYNGNKIYANIVPSSTEKDYYLIRTSNEANILKTILIALAIDFFVSQ
ncbi:MAG: hypothetical protein PHI19_08120 [Clostridia bacterium]|nr:hypothetical protein [Clostridia bacterium]